MNPFEEKKDFAPILMSFTEARLPGCIQTKCDNCSNFVWEHQANIELVRSRKGWVICEYCVVAVNALHPGLLPAFEGQLWQGSFRAEPEMSEGAERLIALIEALRTRTPPV